jgi:hypothetical protein
VVRTCAYRLQPVTWGVDETDWMGDRVSRGLAYTCSGASAGKFASREYVFSQYASSR